MIIENDFVSRWHKVKIIKCIQYGKRNKKSLQKYPYAMVSYLVNG